MRWGGGGGNREDGEVHEDRKIPHNREDFELCSGLVEIWDFVKSVSIRKNYRRRHPFVFTSHINSI